MIRLRSKNTFKLGTLVLILFTFQFSSCNRHIAKNIPTNKIDNENITQPLFSSQNTMFPQIHTNLNGMVREFVRTMYQDKKGDYWFGTNGNGIIRYNGKTLEKITIESSHQWVSVREIVEDKVGNVWFGTSSGLIKYDGEKFTTFSENEGLQDEEIWGLAIDKSGQIWVGSIGGLSNFDGEKFIPFSLPETMVENPQHMLSDKLVKKIIED